MQLTNYLDYFQSQSNNIVLTLILGSSLSEEVGCLSRLDSSDDDGDGETELVVVMETAATPLAMTAGGNLAIGAAEG
jgi:hypothetical protein